MTYDEFAIKENLPEFEGFLQCATPPSKVVKVHPDSAARSSLFFGQYEISPPEHMTGVSDTPGIFRMPDRSTRVKNSDTALFRDFIQPFRLVDPIQLFHQRLAPGEGFHH